MWDWDDDNPWKKEEKKYSDWQDDGNDYDDSHYGNVDCGHDQHLLYKIIKCLCILKRENSKMTKKCFAIIDWV